MYLHIYFHACAAKFFNRWQYTERQIHSLCYSIPEDTINSVNFKYQEQYATVNIPKTYFISSNSPSGGTKLTVFSELNLVRFTHWWKVTSSSSIVLPLYTKSELGENHGKCYQLVWITVLNKGYLLAGRDFISDSFSRPILSFNPNFKSGIPERKHFIKTFPVTSHRRTLPKQLP